jgi:uridine phosphorylase
MTGWLGDKRISVVSTGIGTDNIDIVLTELDALVNIDLQMREDKQNKTHLSIVRIGTSGGLQPFTPEGTFVVSQYGIGFDGLLNYYAGRDAVCDLNFERAFVQQTGYDAKFAAPYCIATSAALTRQIAGDDMVLGTTISAPGFYGPQGRAIRVPLHDASLNEKIMQFEYEGHRITNFEMEGSAIAGLSALMGHEATTVCLIIANRLGKRFIGSYDEKMKELITTVLERI